MDELSLSDVDCLSPKVCIAAGVHRYVERFEVPGDIDPHVSIKNRPLIVAKSPGGWAEMDFPAIPQDHSGELVTAAMAEEISCVPTSRTVSLRTTYCVVTGRYEAFTVHADDVFEQGPLTAVWNGVRWRLVQKPTQPTLTSVERHELECVTAQKCFSLSRGIRSSDRFDTWDGRRWTPRTIPGDTAHRVPSALSCWRVRRCVILGSNSSERHPRVYRDYVTLLSRRGWRSHSLPGENNGLSAISCRTARRCIAVGSDISVVGSASSDSWRHVQMRGDTSYFFAIACPTAATCLAIGGTPPYPDVRAAQWFDGRQWHDASPPSPTAGRLSGDVGVECLRVWSCFVTNGGSGVPEAEILSKWDGSEWRYESVTAKPYTDPPS